MQAGSLSSHATDGSEGKAGCPKQRGALALCTPGTTAMRDIKRKPEPQQPVWVEAAGGPEWAGPYPGDPPNPPALSWLLRVPMPRLDTSDTLLQQPCRPG